MKEWFNMLLHVDNRSRLSSIYNYMKAEIKIAKTFACIYRYP